MIQRKLFRNINYKRPRISDSKSEGRSFGQRDMNAETDICKDTEIQRYRDRDNQTLIQRQRYVQKEGRHTETVIQML